MRRIGGTRALFAMVVLMAVEPAPAVAGPHGGFRGGGGSHGARSHATVRHGGSVVGGHASRPPVRDHRASAPGSGARPYVGHHVYVGTWPYHGGYGYHGYWPYGGYGYYRGAYDGDYRAPYGGPPGTVALDPAPAAPRRSQLAVAAHLGQLERDDGVAAGTAGVSLRWRGRMLEAEVELGRRVYADGDRAERSLAATLYANLGRIELLHPYLLAGAGVLDSERMFGAVGAGLALPLASRLEVAGDLRATSIAARMSHDLELGQQARTGSFEGRLSLIVGF